MRCAYELRRLRPRRNLLRTALTLLAGLSAFAASPQLQIPTASAQGPGAPFATAAKRQAPRAKTTTLPSITVQEHAQAKPYFIEFRARAATSYGHTYALIGKLNARGEVVESEVAGLHPFTESAIPWMIGHLVPVPSEKGASDGDNEDQFVMARFRVLLSAEEYRTVLSFIRQLQDNAPVWHGLLYNCNQFAGNIAYAMGYERPLTSLLWPQVYIDSLRELNINRPPGPDTIGTPVQVEDAATLRERALRALEAKQNPPPAPPPTTIGRRSTHAKAIRSASSRPNN